MPFAFIRLPFWLITVALCVHSSADAQTLVHRFENIANIQRYEVEPGVFVWGGLLNGTNDFHIYNSDFELISVIPVPFNPREVSVRKLSPLKYMEDDSDRLTLAIQYYSGNNWPQHDVFWLFNEEGETLIHIPQVYMRAEFHSKVVTPRQSVLVLTELLGFNTFTPYNKIFLQGQFDTPIQRTGCCIRFVDNVNEVIYAHIENDGSVKFRNHDLTLRIVAPGYENHPQTSMRLGVCAPGIWTKSHGIEYMIGGNGTAKIHRHDGTFVRHILFQNPFTLGNPNHLFQTNGSGGPTTRYLSLPGFKEFGETPCWSSMLRALNQSDYVNISFCSWVQFPGLFEVYHLINGELEYWHSIQVEIPQTQFSAIHPSHIRNDFFSVDSEVHYVYGYQALNPETNLWGNKLVIANSNADILWHEDAETMNLFYGEPGEPNWFFTFDTRKNSTYSAGVFKTVVTIERIEEDESLVETDVFMAFPNPTEELIEFRSADGSIESIEFFDSLGRIVPFSLILIHPSDLGVVVNLGLLTSGVYIAVVSTSSAKKTIRVIKR